MPDRRRGISILAVASVAAALAAGPAQGKTACAFEAQSADKSERGLALHEAPNAAAKVLGYVPNVEDKDGSVRDRPAPLAASKSDHFTRPSSQAVSSTIH
jgi:hypothetical protein